MLRLTEMGQTSVTAIRSLIRCSQTRNLGVVLSVAMHAGFAGIPKRPASESLFKR